MSQMFAFRNVKFNIKMAIERFVEALNKSILTVIDIFTVLFIVECII